MINLYSFLVSRFSLKAPNWATVMRYPQRKNKTNIYCQVLVGHFPIQTQRIIAQSKDHLVVIRGVANLVPRVQEDR